MYNHEPAGYDCPFCREDPARATRPIEILRRYERVTVRLNPKWWPNNPGGTLVVPHDHVENVYDLPPELGTPMQEAIRDTALALKTAFDCDGVSTRQHNEPAGNQDVWHYHLHVFPRFTDDGLYASRGEWVDADRMRSYADRIRAAWPDA